MRMLGTSILCLLLLGTAACGKGGDDLVFMMWGTGEERETVEGYLEEFAKLYPDIGKPKVIQTGSFEYWQKLQVMVAADETPDVFYMGFEEVQPYRQQDVLLDLEPFVQRDKMDLDDFYDKLVESFRIDGKLYGIPKDFTPFVLYYNRDLFKAAGVQEPDEDWTWNDLRQAAVRLTEREAGSVKTYGFVVEDWASWIPSWIWSNGGDYMDGGKWVFGREPWLSRNAQTFDFLVSLITRDKVAPDVGTRKQMGGSDAFTSGKVAMCLLGRWAVLQFCRIQNFRWNVALFPKSPHTKKRVPSLVTAAYSISKKTRRAEDAWKLVQFLTGKDAQRLVARSGQAVPARRSIAESDDFLNAEEVNKFQTALGNTVDHHVFLDSVPEGRLTPSHPNWLKIRDSLSQWFQPVYLGSMPARDKLQETQPKFEALLQ